MHDLRGKHVSNSETKQNLNGFKNGESKIHGQANTNWDVRQISINVWKRFKYHVKNVCHRFWSSSKRFIVKSDYWRSYIRSPVFFLLKNFTFRWDDQLFRFYLSFTVNFTTKKYHWNKDLHISLAIYSRPKKSVFQFEMTKLELEHLVTNIHWNGLLQIIAVLKLNKLDKFATA